MQKHVKIYLRYFHLGEEDIWECEVCGVQKRIVNFDIHHINGRGKKGDVITNLMCLCRKDHDSCKGIGGTYLRRDTIQNIHNNFLNNR